MVSRQLLLLLVRRTAEEGVVVRHLVLRHHLAHLSLQVLLDILVRLDRSGRSVLLLGRLALQNLLDHLVR